MTRLILLAASATALAVLSGCATVKTETVQYQHDDVTLEGYLAKPCMTIGKKPGVLVIHEWWGLNDYAKLRTRELAEMGYVAFACDVYGQGQVTEDASQAQQWATPFYQDRALFRDRLNAGLEQLKQHPDVDSSKLAAIGFCFGGTAALELARSGADVDGVVSFHGGLANPNPGDNDQINAKVLVLNGYDDPMVPMEDRAALKENLTEANVDWVFVDFANTVHSFTNPGADEKEIDGVGYNAWAADEAWRMMQLFLADVFTQSGAVQTVAPQSGTN